MGVIIGMDPHKRSATIEVIDQAGRAIAVGRFGTDRAGYAELLTAGREHPDLVWAVEGCNGIGRHIAHRLVHDGEVVVDVPAKLSAQVRVFATGNGRKTDPDDRLDPGLRRVEVDEDLVVMSLPKGGKTRTVPLPDSVRAELAAHLKRFPPVEVSLPWFSPVGEVVAVPLFITSRERKSLNRTYFNSGHWRKALGAADLEPSRSNGCHALRYFYASTLLDAGESIKAVSQYLGHPDPAFTRRTYTYLMPANDERTRHAIDGGLGATGVYQGEKAPAAPQVSGGLN